MKIECGPPIEGIERIDPQRQILLLGEMHGTAEVPAFLSNLACRLATSGRVHVGLEIPTSESAAVARFLSSAGGKEPQAELLRAEFWAGKLQDGRSSVAMVSLLESIRHYRQQGLPLEVFLMDSVTGDRDVAMAEKVAEKRRLHPDDSLLILAGNLHTQTSQGTPWDANFSPMGWHLRRRKLQVLSLYATGSTGTAWVCSGPGTCGPIQVPGRDRGLPVPSIVVMVGERDGYDGSVYLGAFTASPPAVHGSTTRVAE